MSLKPYISRLLALLLVLVIGLVGCSTNPSGLSGSYREDTLTVLQSLQNAVATPVEEPGQAGIREDVRAQMNDYVARYRRDNKVAGLRSFTTMQTAINALAGYYSSYGSRPLPEKLKKRLDQEFKQVEISLRRGL